MEDINPTWSAIKSIIYGLKSGISVKRSVFESSKGLETAFERFLFQWINSPTSNSMPAQMYKLTPLQQAMVLILMDGLNGSPVVEVLESLEKEIRLSCSRELEIHILKLPFLGMIPLMLFIGPAFLLLLVGPILSQLIMELSK